MKIIIQNTSKQLPNNQKNLFEIREDNTLMPLITPCPTNTISKSQIQNSKD
ncbi:hypothetical protein RT41_GL001313 [Lactococcus fujiensis JCM 16395]|uniref:Uncharacterized protein n=1 Tax=Lactococcus fujiensis JCM 16395 TaxID=1291764 RepID=A0A2A5RMC0_9LACT|nr:hypothetical protein RT41_GL001313 [Lactococcus fujiensis JCM 16395]